MVYVYCGILGLYLILFLLSMGEAGNPFQKMAARIYRKQREGMGKSKNSRRNWKRALRARQLGDKLKTLQPEEGAEQQVRGYYLSLYSTLLMVVFAGDLLCLAAWGSAYGNAKLIDGNTLLRKAYGEGDVKVELLAEIPGIQEEAFDYVVKERRLTEEELERSYAQASELLPEAILGENERLEDVRKDLKLVSGLDGCPFRISWESEAYSLVNSDGTVHNEELVKGEVVTLTAQFRYEDWSWQFMCRSIP